MKSKTNSVYDILKIVLSIMVVLIHGKIFPNILYPWLRIAVPLFFVMSSYFLFSKLNKENDSVKRKEIIKLFILRNLKLYLIWFIILLPITLDIKKYFINHGFIKSIVILLRDFIFHSTFQSSWYIIALVEGTVIIYFCSKKISNKVLISLSTIIYLLITLIGTYTFILPYESFPSIIRNIILAPPNSFLVSFIWIMIGKLFAEGKINYSHKTNIIVLIISMIMLYLEWTFIKGKITAVNRDCYIMLIPLTISLFYLIINIKAFYFEQSLFLRKISTIMYVSHKSFIHVYNNWVMINNKYIVFLLVVITCVILTMIISYLSKRWLKFLKYAY